MNTTGNRRFTSIIIASIRSCSVFRSSAAFFSCTLGSGFLKKKSLMREIIEGALRIDYPDFAQRMHRGCQIVFRQRLAFVRQFEELFPEAIDLVARARGSRALQSARGIVI